MGSQVKAKLAAGVIVVAGATLVAASPALQEFLGRWEGKGEYVVYADKLAQGLPTVCKGITKHVTRTPIIVGERWSEEKCAAEEAAAIAKVQRSLATCFLYPPPQEVFDAATSHAWNNGVAATCNSAAMRAWNAEQWALGCRRLALSDSDRPVWSYVKTGRTLPNGRPEYKFVQGLANRRQAERGWCMYGVRP